MYNGIGLATVRGSGTNGYVTKNMAFVSASRAAERKDRTEGFKRDIPQPKQPDQDIIEHNRKRDVEVKVLRLRESLEDKGVDEAEIEERCPPSDEMRPDPSPSSFVCARRNLTTTGRCPSLWTRSGQDAWVTSSSATATSWSPGEMPRPDATPVV